MIILLLDDKYINKLINLSEFYLLWQTKSIPGQVNLSQIGGLFSWVIRPYKKLSQIGGLFSWDLFIWMNKPVI